MRAPGGRLDSSQGRVGSGAGLRAEVGASSHQKNSLNHAPIFESTAEATVVAPSPV